MFDATRAGARMTDLASLFVAWVAALLIAFVAVWGASIILGVLTLVGLAILIPWTIGKSRDYRLARTMERESASERPST